MSRTRTSTTRSRSTSAVSRTGRLPGPADKDVVRFSLEATEHVVIRLEPPADGAVRLRLTCGGTELLRVREPVVGQPFVYDTQLELGDYELTMTAATASIEPYHLTVERADPWTLPAVLRAERHRRWRARRARDTRGVRRGLGQAGRGRRLVQRRGVPDPTQPLLVDVEGEVVGLLLTDGSSTVGIDPDRARTTWTSRALPSDHPLYLQVASGGDYRLRLRGAGLVPVEAPWCSAYAVAPRSRP